MSSPLTAYWIHSSGAPLSQCYGVTAFSKSDALSLLRSSGLPLPSDLTQLHITENIRLADLDASHALPNIGPIILRGIWFPFTTVGA